jgi:hypothetical protein
MLIAATAALVLAVGAAVGTAALAGDEEKGRPWLGVALMSTEEESQVRIAEVFEESPAEGAGIREGDAVVSVDGTPVSSAGALVEIVGERSPGDRLELVLEDEEGGQRTVVVTLAERPDDLHWSFRGLAGLEGLEELKELQKLGDHFVLDCEGEDCEDALILRRAGDHFLLGAGPARAYLGVELTEPSDQLRGYFGAEEDEGVLVNRVLVGSPADQAGLQAGDLIVALEDQAVGGSGDLVRALREHEPGEAVGLSILRDRSRQELRVDLGENPHRELRFERFYRNDPDGAHLELLDEQRLREIQESARKAQAEAQLRFRAAMDRSREERLAIRESREAYREAMRERARERSLSLLEREELEEHLRHLREELNLLREGLEDEHLKLLRFQEELPGLPTPPAGAGRNLLMA